MAAGALAAPSNNSATATIAEKHFMFVRP
jgi:hypothetical protein